MVAYADDVIIGLNPGITAAQGIEAAKQIYAEIGLTISVDKCHFTEGGKTVYFLGQPYARGQQLHAAHNLLEIAKRKCQILKQFPSLRRTSAYIMLSRSVLPSINYGPLCDPGDPE